MPSAPPVLEVRGISKRFPGVLANDNINLTLRKGQVLGLLGENGAGKSTLMNMIYGLYKPDQGEILVNGAAVDIAGPKDAIELGIGMVHQHFQLVEALTGMRPVDDGRFFIKGEDMTSSPPRRVTEKGVGHVPEDRQRYGLVAGFTVMHNLVLCTYYRDEFSDIIVVDDRAIADNAHQLVEQYDVRPPIINNLAGGLSGGNQQKVIVAREFSRDVDLLIASQPTRGLDVGSIEFIHRQIIRMRDEGAAILLVSSGLDEVLSLSDRVAVMFEGQIIDILPIESADKDTVGLRMACIRAASGGGAA